MGLGFRVTARAFDLGLRILNHVRNAASAFGAKLPTFGLRHSLGEQNWQRADESQAHVCCSSCFGTLSQDHTPSS